MTKIKVGIVGYGNLGKGVETGLDQVDDMEVYGIFTRRNPKTINSSHPVFAYEDIHSHKGQVDLLILCGGSKTDIPVQAPELIQHFSTVDCFDTHKKIPEYFEEINQIALNNQTVSVIATGWDPGLFSIQRVLQEAVLPKGQSYTFWGRGLSQGHSDALRKINGVADAVQYTVPKEKMVKAVNAGQSVDYSAQKGHLRECFVVLEDDTPENRKKISQEIVTMPDYFQGYETQVYFISQDELEANHQGLPHGGHVIRRGQTQTGHTNLIDFSLDLESNPEFTAAVSLAYARACYKLTNNQDYGAKTVFDIPIKYLSPKPYHHLLRDDL
ncbi:MAG TPA: diaminopimelate dehydrogenase [Alloiococcus sp.]|nr:diaminopimelate dehydrogenase [Alloiococcus sp.]